MSLQSQLDTLESVFARDEPCGYSDTSPAATEPTVWTALAQNSAGRSENADRAADWIASLQLANGSVGIAADAPDPCWPTALALLLWQRTNPQKYTRNIELATEWSLGARGTTLPPDPHIGHNTTLIGWSWAAGTHSWIEPTAFFVMGLRACGLAGHARTREGIALLVDRLLPQGGCNYGNTKVLGQYLVDHLQPSGIVLWALADEKVVDPRIERSLEYLASAVQRPTGSASLAFALLALSAWHRTPADAAKLILRAWNRPTTRQSPYRQALLALAALGAEKPLGLCRAPIL
jgi:hypothetical protein